MPISTITTAQGCQDWARLQQRAARNLNLEQLGAVVATLARWTRKELVDSG